MTFVIGLLFAAIAYGSMTDPEHGFLVFGLGLMVVALFEEFCGYRLAFTRLKKSSQSSIEEGEESSIEEGEDNG